MLIPASVLWDLGYFLYISGSIFIIILAIWQVKESYHGLMERKRSCCQSHQKVRQGARDAASRARRHSQEEAEKPWELLSVMRSQGWLPQEGSVRQLLCEDPCCQTCNSMALEIQQVLADENTLVSPTSGEPAQGSSCLEVLSTPKVSFQQSMEHRSPHSKNLSLPSANLTVSQKSLAQSVARSPGTAGIHDYWAEDLKQRQGFQMPEVPRGPETMLSSRFEEPRVSVNLQEIIQSHPNLVYGNQGQQPLNSQVSLLTLNREITALTHPMALNMVTVLPAHLPFLCPEVLRLLEVHVRRLMHFQRWGLPRRVEESLRQLMPNPPLFCHPVHNQPVSFIQNDISQFSIEKFGTISYQNWGSCIAGQPTQAFWVSEWSIMDPEQRHYYQQIPDHMTLASPYVALKESSGLYLMPGQQASDSEGPVQSKYSQLFCGLPSLHSESLVDTFLGYQGLSMNESMSKHSLKYPFLFKELSCFPLMPKTLPQSALPSSPSSPNWTAPPEHQQAQISSPLLTLDECKALEWHLLQRQLQLQWDFPDVFQRDQHTESPMQCKPSDQAQSSETVKTSWPGQPVSTITKELFFPEQARRLLEFHLQRQLVHNHSSLPWKNQRSLQLPLPPAGQQTLSWSSRALDNVNVPQPTALEGTGVGDPLPAIKDPASVPMLHVTDQAKATLQSHVDSKCKEIHQGKVPVCIHGSCEFKIPGGLQVAPFTCIPESKPLELQAVDDLDKQQEVTPWMPTALDQQQQASSDALIKHPKLPWSLSQGAIEKLKTTLQHKYLAFLSGLPAPYYVALSRATAPAITSAAMKTEMEPGPIQFPTEPPTQVPSPEEKGLSPGPGFQDGSEACADAAGEFQAEVQMEGIIKMVPQESQAGPARPCSLREPILTKLNFHLRKKILEIQLGIPLKARESREQTVAMPKNMCPQESPGNLDNQGKLPLQDLPVPPDTPRSPDPEWLHLTEELATELKTAHQKQKQHHSGAAHRESVHWAAQISQSSGDMTEAKAQVLCAQLEASVNNPSLEEAWSSEPHRPDKSKDSAQVPTLAEKRKKPGKPKSAGDRGEGDASFILSSTREKSHSAEAQRPEEVLLNRTPCSSCCQRRHFHLDAPCQHSPEHHPQLKLPELPPGVPEGKDSEKNDLRASQAKLNVILKPARVPENAQPVAPQVSQGQSFLGQLTPGNPLWGHTLQEQMLQGPVMPGYTHQMPSLPDSGFRNKMKSFLHCINLKTKGKGHKESTSPTSEKMANTRKVNAAKSLAPAKSPKERPKTEKTRGVLKAQLPPPEKQMGLAFTDIPRSLDSKLWQHSHSHQLRSASVLSTPHHCPRHCPRVVCATQPGNPP
ncbi:protein SPATA31F1-like [Ovis canadensis]|uniref:protein SPATA31F1-like n=1 Tax=Ovis canadensis TaxID=37174 RepID=UPI003750B80C